MFGWKRNKEKDLMYQSLEEEIRFIWFKERLKSEAAADAKKIAEREERLHREAINDVYGAHGQG